MTRPRTAKLQLKLKLRSLRAVTRVRAATERKVFEGVTQAPKASDSALADATDVDTVRSKLWAPQRLLNNRKGGLSATYKKNTETNTSAYDLNQKTMQALDTLAEEYEIFEETMRKVTFETEEGDMLCAVASEVGEELDRVLKDQDRLHDELEFTCEEVVTAS